MAPSLAASLASLTGLDEATAAEQILPHLNSLPTQGEIRGYLESLLAPGPASQSFLQSYLSSRFPSAPSSSAAPSSNSRRWGASPSTSSSNSRANSPLSPPVNKAEQAQKLQQAFAGAGGRVYVKEREEDLGGWGSHKGGSQAASRASSASRALAPPVPPVVPSPAPSSSSTRNSSPAPQAAAQAKGKGKAPAPPQKPHEEGGVVLSEEAVKELSTIERALKQFQPNGGRKEGKGVRCFCQARSHPLSTYTPSCPRCALVLCTLNAPSLPCPSCAHSPLLPSAVLASHIATLCESRESLLARERARAKREKDQAERERAAIRFPELGADYTGVDRRGMGGGGGYAQHAGGGLSMADRIERASANGTDIHGRKQAETRTEKVREQVQGKVLRLGTNGKVKVQTKRILPPTQKGGKTRLEEQTIAVIDPADSDEEEAATVFFDEDDDGVRGEVALVSARAEREGWLAPIGQRGGGVFSRVTLHAEDRPVWTPQEEGGGGYLVDVDPTETGAAGERGEAPSSTGEKKSEPVAVVQQQQQRAVPGAAKTDGEEGKKTKRGRGKGKGAAAAKEGGEGEGETVKKEEGRKKAEEKNKVEAMPAAGEDAGWAS